MMAALRTFIAILALAARAHPATISVRAEEKVTLQLEPLLTGGFQMVLIQDDQKISFGQIGRTLLSPYAIEEIDEGVAVQIGAANLTLHTLIDEERGARGIKVKWDTTPLTRLEDCFDFGTKHWYAGPMQQNQVYPIEKAEQRYAPYFPKEDDNGAIIERYWLNSDGEYIYVHGQVPLFIDYNNLQSNHLCFGAQIADPYSFRRTHNELAYDIWFLSDVKSAHKHAVDNYLGKPSGVPDYRMVQHPIWSTWAQYSRDIDETNLLEFAMEIRDNGFNNSQFEIDDLWEICYGSLTVDERKFSNFTKTVQDIKAMGYRVTIWMHPFINKDCDPWYSDALEMGYLVLNESGSPDTSWWNNNGSIPGYIDFTNPEAAEWWYQRVKYIVDTYDIDSLKFDAGESSFSPQISVQNGSIDFQPHHIVEAYVRTCARFGDMIEVRTGFRTQDLPVFVRMVDRDSIWGLNNGLSTIITTSIQMNLNGYTLVLPDMIGGNGLNLGHEQSALPTKELFIRWVQANTFLPAMQYSYVPWNFDNETVVISKKYTELHAAYADHIYAAMQASVEDGSPVIAPLWWLDPHDNVTLDIYDEYVLGETILVAPVLVEGATLRDIYLPSGNWLEEGNPERVVVGPVWLRNYNAPIDVLPFFVRRDPIPSSAVSPTVATFLVLCGLLINYMQE